MCIIKQYSLWNLRSIKRINKTDKWKKKKNPKVNGKYIYTYITVPLHRYLRCAGYRFQLYTPRTTCVHACAVYVRTIIYKQYIHRFIITISCMYGVNVYNTHKCTIYSYIYIIIHVRCVPTWIRQRVLNFFFYVLIFLNE